MAQVIPYMRFSSPKQEKGDSLERQEAVIRTFCDAQGWTPSEPVRDLGRSAWKGDHLRSGNLGKLTQRIIAGEFERGSIVVVEEFDRLSRQGYEVTTDWLRLVTDAGIIVAVAKSGRIIDREALRNSPLEMIQILIRGQLAQEESTRKSGNVASAWRKKLEATGSGVVLTKGCPGWLEVVGAGLGDQGTPYRINAVRAEAIRLVYQWAAEGDGLNTISKRLNGQFQAWGRSGEGFNVTQIRRWLESASVEGDFIPYEHNASKPNGDRVVGYYPRIVDADLVRRARASFRSRKGTGGPRVKNTYPNIFMGMFSCGVCGSKVVIKRTEGPGYMRCQSAELGRKCDNTRLYRFRDFEKAAVPYILRLGMDDRFLRQGTNISGAAEADAQAKKRVEDLTQEMARLTDVMGKVADPTALIARYDTLSVDLLEANAVADAAEKALSRARGQVDEVERLAASRKLHNAINDGDPEIRLRARQRLHEAARAIVTTIICDPVDDYRGQPEPTMTMAILGGLYAVKVSNRGEVIEAVSDGLRIAVDSPEIRRGALSATHHTADQIDAVLMRCTT